MPFTLSSAHMDCFDGDDAWGHGHARKHHLQEMTVLILDLLALEDYECLGLL